MAGAGGGTRDRTVNTAGGGSGGSVTQGSTPWTVAGTVTVAGLQNNALTDAELRFAPVPISVASLPLPAGAATAANQQTDALTDGELRASPVPVSGTVITQNLTFAADKVDASGTVLGAGNNNIGDVDVALLPTFGAGQATYLEDTAHTTGDRGAFVLGVATDNTTFAVEGDYVPFATDVQGRTKIIHPTVAAAVNDGDTNSEQYLSGYITGGTVGPIRIASRIFAFNGTTWDRVRGDTTNGLDVDVTRLPAGTTRIGGTYTVSGNIIDNDGDVLTVKVAHLDMSTATTTDIVPAVATKKIRVIGWEMNTTEPATVTDVNFVTGAATTRVTGSPRVRLSADQLRASRDASTGAWLFETVAGEALRVTNSAAADVNITVYYIEV